MAEVAATYRCDGNSEADKRRKGAEKGIRSSVFSFSTLETSKLFIASYLKRTKYRSNIWPGNDAPRENLPDLFILHRSWNIGEENLCEIVMINASSPLQLSHFEQSGGLNDGE